uniref:Uncharacterized protein n=1 Tax=Calidris pygmaea TaxID=425635 RepID=A0A8C3JDA0_9CHAR
HFFEAIRVILGNLDDLHPFSTDHFTIFPYLSKWERVSKMRFKHENVHLVPYPYICTMYLELNSFQQNVSCGKSLWLCLDNFWKHLSSMSCFSLSFLIYRVFEFKGANLLVSTYKKRSCPFIIFVARCWAHPIEYPSCPGEPSLDRAHRPRQPEQRGRITSLKLLAKLFLMHLSWPPSARGRNAGSCWLTSS